MADLDALGRASSELTVSVEEEEASNAGSGIVSLNVAQRQGLESIACVLCPEPSCEVLETGVDRH